MYKYLAVNKTNGDFYLGLSNQKYMSTAFANSLKGEKSSDYHLFRLSTKSEIDDAFYFITNNLNSNRIRFNTLKLNEEESLIAHCLNKRLCQRELFVDAFKEHLSDYNKLLIVVYNELHYTVKGA